MLSPVSDKGATPTAGALLPRRFEHAGFQLMTLQQAVELGAIALGEA
jgi:hypothetical protein